MWDGLSEQRLGGTELGSVPRLRVSGLNGALCSMHVHQRAFCVLRYCFRGPVCIIRLPGDMDLSGPAAAVGGLGKGRGDVE